MPEYDMPIEEQMRLLVKKLDGFEKRVDERFDTIDAKFVKIDEKFDKVDERFVKIDERFVKIDEKFDKIDETLHALEGNVGTLSGKFETLDASVTSKFDKIMVRLDETKAVATLGLEGLQGLRESMDAQFAAAAKTNADQTGLLKSVLVHVRNRVDVIERPKPRRR